MIIQQIRSATIKVTYGKNTFLVDPWLQDQGKGFSVKPVKEEMHEGVDFYLNTHFHRDHALIDRKDIQKHKDKHQMDRLLI